MSDTPTRQAYSELQEAYGYFNTHLFNDDLPPCLITLQRKGHKVMGYFSHSRFGHRTEERTTDEIAMNPIHFKTKNDIEVLQTLVHEMCHLWQAHHGLHQSRTAYHNKEWGSKMEAIGLMPSSTGQPGGKRSGQKMGDYVIVGGPFDRAARALVAQGFKLSWYDRAAELLKPAPTGNGNGESDDTPEPQSGKRIKYTCPSCAANAWGKSSLNLICGACKTVFEPA